MFPVPPACTNRRISERRGGKPCVSVKSISSGYLIAAMIAYAWKRCQGSELFFPCFLLGGKRQIDPFACQNWRR